MKKFFAIAQLISIILITICSLILAISGALTHRCIPLLFGIIGLILPLIYFKDKEE